MKAEEGEGVEGGRGVLVGPVVGVAKEGTGSAGTGEGEGETAGGGVVEVVGTTGAGV